MTLAAGGRTVVVVDRNEHALRELPDGVRREVADTTDPSVATPLIDRIAGEVGPPDVLVNTIGAFRPGDALTTTPETLRLMIDVNLGPALWPSRALAPHMRRQGSGVIVHVAARPGIEPSGGMAAYSASKAALVHLTRILDIELRPHGIRVNAVAPEAIAGRDRIPGQRRCRAGKRSDTPRVRRLTKMGVSVPQVRRLAAVRVATVVPRAFGVKGIDGRDPLAVSDPINARQIVVHLLPANTALPTDTGPYPFHTVIDNQRMVGIEVWEQVGPVESEDPAENRKVGEGLLRNLPPRLPARTAVEVTFFMSETGLLTVHATEPVCGTELRFDLQIGDLDQAGMEKARQSVARYQVSG